MLHCHSEEIRGIARKLLDAWTRADLRELERAMAEAEDCTVASLSAARPDSEYGELLLAVIENTRATIGGVSRGTGLSRETMSVSYDLLRHIADFPAIQ
jgi:hypothetical protein